MSYGNDEYTYFLNSCYINNGCGFTQLIGKNEMRKIKNNKHFLLLFFAIFLAGCALEQAIDADSGSGYPDLEGTIINYEYEGFSAFRFAIANNQVRWTGISGYFEGATAEVIPQISKVADGIYFSSWQTVADGGDNVVHNFNTMRVNAHLNPGNADEAMENIYGTIQCWSESECNPPNEEVTDPMVRGGLILTNMQEKQLPPLFDRELNIVPKSDADRIARAELAGMAIEYETSYGSTRIEVDGAQTRVSENQGNAEVFDTYATKLTDDIYFISWKGANGGNHVIINRDTAKVFDHISPSGERAEQIYDLACFDTVDAC